MTPEQLREAANVMLAAADGKKIQQREYGDDPWRDLSETSGGHISWNWDRFSYRIKPEPRKVKVQMMKHKDDKRYLVCAMECDFSRYELGGWKPVSDLVEIEVRDE